jgi:hypothetical protein
VAVYNVDGAMAREVEIKVLCEEEEHIISLLANCPGQH